MADAVFVTVGVGAFTTEETQVTISLTQSLCGLNHASMGKQHTCLEIALHIIVPVAIPGSTVLTLVAPIRLMRNGLPTGESGIN